MILSKPLNKFVFKPVFFHIKVVVGNINEHVGYLRYESATSETNNVVLYGVAGGGIVGVLVIISVVVIMMRRSIKKKIDKTKTEMNEMKEEISKIVVKEDGMFVFFYNHLVSNGECLP